MLPSIPSHPPPRERQEQLMGYRKRGPKPKPLVVQVNILGGPSLSISLPLDLATRAASRPRRQNALFSRAPNSTSLLLDLPMLPL